MASAEQAEYVWVRVFTKGEDGKRTPMGRVTRVRRPAAMIVDDLCKAVKAEKPNALAHCDADELQVYPPNPNPKDTNYPTDETKAYKPSFGDFPETTDEDPLVVFAPAQTGGSGAGRDENKVVEMLQALQVEQRALQMDVALVRNGMPAVQTLPALTPSRATNSPVESDHLFEQLGMETSPVVDDGSFEAPQTCNWANLHFQWSTFRRKGQKDEALEKASYTPLLDYLSSLDWEEVKETQVKCFNIANGEGLSNSLLFKENVHTLRQQDPWAVRGQSVSFIRSIQGRSDLVVTKNFNRGKILRWHVKFAVEVKTPTMMSSSTTGCVREASLQVIGMCVNNPNNAPPVILTNLAKKHQVFYLTRIKPTDRHVGERFVLRQRNCWTFRDAVYFAHQVSNESGRRGMCQHFGRRSSGIPEE